MGDSSYLIESFKERRDIMNFEIFNDFSGLWVMWEIGGINLRSTNFEIGEPSACSEN